MDDLDYRLLTLLEGQSVVRPVEHTDASRRAFQAVVERLFALRDRGLIHFHENHTSKSESGDYLMVWALHDYRRRACSAEKRPRAGASSPRGLMIGRGVIERDN